jgi:Flp pilus assembly CpaE family ATPase
LLIERASIKAADRLVVLAAEEGLGAALPTTAGLVPLVEALTRAGDWVVADVPRDVVLRESEAIASAAAIVVVSDLSLAGLREVLRFKEWAAGVAPEAKLLVVAGGARPKLEGDLPAAEFARAATLAFAAEIPYDGKVVGACAAASKPILTAAPRSNAARAIRGLAERIAGAPEEKRSGVFSFTAFLPARAKAFLARGGHK